MNRIASVKHWLVDNEVRAGWAVGLAIAAIGIPTLIRGELNGIVSGCESVAFVPFVLLSAIFLGWRWAALVAVASALIFDAFFMGTPGRILEGSCNVFGVGSFLIGSTMIIGFVEAIRREVDRLPTDKPTGGIVFSLQDGEAWASWYGQSAPVRLGRQEEVAEMMEDFLAQLEVGKRLNGAS
jgi:hypothetical protein